MVTFKRQKLTDSAISKIQQFLLFTDWSRIDNLSVNNAYGYLISKITEVLDQYALADLRGGARDARPPPGGPNSFIFMQFSGTKLKNNSTFGSWRPPLGKILDPPLVCSKETDKGETGQLLS